jgi:hypothetical protein
MAKALRCLFLLVGFSAAILVCCGKQKEEIDFRAGPAEESGRTLSLPMIEILPKDPVPGWRMRGTPEYYDRSDLYEYMDGGAERYLSAGFEGLLTCVYTAAPEKMGGPGEGEDPDVRVELYRLNSRSNARSLFALERSQGFRDFAAGEHGALGRLTLLFCREEFYIKLMAYRGSGAVQEILKKLAAGIDERIVETKSNEGP